MSQQKWDRISEVGSFVAIFLAFAWICGHVLVWMVNGCPVKY